MVTLCIFVSSMHIIMKKTLVSFYKKHASAKQSLLNWYAEVDKTVWEKPNDVVRQFSSADIINNKRVVFNIKGNNYRLIADIEYYYKKVFIVWIGTHADYDKIDAKTIKYVKTN